MRYVVDPVHTTCHQVEVVTLVLFIHSVYITSLHGDIRKNLEKIVGFHEWQAVRLIVYAHSTKLCLARC